MALSKTVPAVITSRFLWSENVAQEQGLKLLSDILTKGVAPHRAVAALFGKLESKEINTPQARWMTPVIFRRYDDRIAKIPEKKPRRGGFMIRTGI